MAEEKNVTMNEGHTAMSSQRALFTEGAVICRRVDREGHGAIGEKLPFTNIYKVTEKRNKMVPVYP